jgi:predicted DNA repair protein MutK
LQPKTAGYLGDDLAVNAEKALDLSSENFPFYGPQKVLNKK